MQEFEQAWTVLKQESFQDILNQMMAEDPHHYDDITSHLNDFRPADMRQSLVDHLTQATSLEDYKNRLREMNDFMDDEIAMQRDVQGEPFLAQFQQLNRGEPMRPFEQAWSLLKSNLRVGGQQNRLANYPEQTFQPRPSDTYRSRMPETGPVQSEAMDPEAVRAMGSRNQTLEQATAQKEAMEDHRYPYHLSQHNPAKRVTMGDLVDIPTSHQLAEMRAEATQRAMQKPYRQLNDYERKLVPVPVGLGTLYG